MLLLLLLPGMPPLLLHCDGLCIGLSISTW
jgi:hypothetical protein